MVMFTCSLNLMKIPYISIIELLIIAIVKKRIGGKQYILKHSVLPWDLSPLFVHGKPFNKVWHFTIIEHPL